MSVQFTSIQRHTHQTSCITLTLPSIQIPGYPTWEIRGEFFPGEKTIEELDAIVPNI
jgi:hypothetical protein